MKTVIHTTIDGYDVVLGFSDPQMDPVATAQKVDPLVRGLAEVKQAETIGQKIADAHQRSSYAAAQLQAASARNDKVAMQSQSQAYSQAQADLQAAQEEIKPVLAAIDEKKRTLMLKNPVWFKPGHAIGADGGTVYEDLLPGTDAEYNDGKTGHVTYETLKASLTDDKHLQLLMDGSTVADYREAVLWSKNASGTWSKRVISKLGEKPEPGETENSDLTDAQRQEIGAQLEAERVAKLNDAEKAAEAASAQKAARAAVAQIQSEVTAGVSTQAELDAAVASYKTELEAINAKYGTSLT